MELALCRPSGAKSVEVVPKIFLKIVYPLIRSFTQIHTSLYVQLFCMTMWLLKQVNLLTPNDDYSGHTASLTSKCYIYTFIQQIEVLNSLNVAYTLRFFLFKMQFVS